MEAFSLNSRLLKDILQHAKPLGHNERPRNLNLGFGFIYYGAVRALRPRHTLVIGSGYGFSVVCLALGLKDNEAGRLSFVDPSYSVFTDGPLKTLGGRNQWDDPQSVGGHFRRFGLDEVVTHYKMTSEQLFEKYDELNLPTIDMAFIDGNHAYKHVKFDFQHVVQRSRRNTYIFLHDSNAYIREALHHAGVKRWIRILKKEDKAFEVINFPFSSGVALVRVVEPAGWKEIAQ
ncbi:MAG: class I SAM-dependent methyltransferase [Desulfomonile sp.]|nr:class I SAM-dependent methyltransferase [Desulfomonile sp.]